MADKPIEKFTRIKGVSDIRRLPRLGKIRLGVKMISKTTGKEYPKETSYFVCPPEVEEAYREEYPDGKITSLDIMFPVNDPEVVFPQAYKFYGQTRGLKCIGNGEVANRYSEDKKEIQQIVCPCELLEQKKCTRRAHLLIMLTKVSLGGVYQIDLGSYHSIVDINSGIDYVRGLTKEILGVDRFALIPLVLKREERITHHEGGKQIHYTLHIYNILNAEQWNSIRNDFKIISPPRLALPPIENINPEKDDGATVVEENGEEVIEEQEEKGAEIPKEKEKTKGDEKIKEGHTKKFIEDYKETYIKCLAISRKMHDSEFSNQEIANFEKLAENHLSKMTKIKAEASLKDMKGSLK